MKSFTIGRRPALYDLNLKTVSRLREKSMSAASVSLAGGMESSDQEMDLAEAARGVISSLVYNTCYCSAYGIVFPIVFLAHFVPGGVTLAAGIGDGARAAGDYVRSVRISRHHQKRHETIYDQESGGR